MHASKVKVLGRKAGCLAKQGGGKKPESADAKDEGTGDATPPSSLLGDLDLEKKTLGGRVRRNCS